MKTCRFVAIVLIVVGCSDRGTEPPSWSKPYEQWKSNNIADYTINQTRICECLSGGQTMKVAVRSGVITSVTRLSDTALMSPPISNVYLTVDSLFAIIRSHNPDSIAVRYNSQYGYPDRLVINPQGLPFDAGVIYETSSLVVP
jgi:hypothetical protein